MKELEIDPCILKTQRYKLKKNRDIEIGELTMNKYFIPIEV